MRTGTKPVKSLITEGTFKVRLVKRLKAIPNSTWMIVEAGSSRGHADIKGSVNGYAVSLEVKRCSSESLKKTGRTVLQRYRLQKSRDAGEYANWCYPENLEQTIKDLEHFNKLPRASLEFSLSAL